MKSILFMGFAPGDALRAAKRLGLNVVMATDAQLTWQTDFIHEQISISPYKP
jgi:hypothetical protein